MSPDLARSLGHRVRNLAAQTDLEPNRLRRHLTFQRLLARLAASGIWVLKGGFCLEVRLGATARATKDLDLALMPQDPVMSALDLQDLLTDELATDLDDDGFRFIVGLPVTISADGLGNPGWRTTIGASVGGSLFESVKLDIVARPQEIAGGVETLVLPPLLPDVPGHEPVRIAAVDVHQHAAEKLHAYGRLYAGNRPSSRVKDLVDLVLLIEAGVLEPQRWADRLIRVYAIRDGSPPPSALPTPPDSWLRPYASMAAELGVAAKTSAQAWSVLRDEYQGVLSLLRAE